jgi:hypothetical protein
MNELAELVRATADAVAQLAALIEGMPKAMDAKLAAHAASVDVTLSNFRAEWRKSETAAVNHEVEVDAKIEGFVASIGEELAKTAQIIADNRAATEGMLAEVKTGVEQIVSKVSEDFEKSIGEVRTACDTTDLHHSVKKLEGTVAENFEQLGGQIVSTLQRANEVEAGASQKLMTLTLSVNDRFSKAEDAVDSLASKIAVQTDRISHHYDILNDGFVKQAVILESHGTMLDEHAAQHEATQRGIGELIVARDNYVEDAGKATDSLWGTVKVLIPRVDAAEKAVGVAAVAIAAVEKEVHAATELITTVDKAAVQANAEVERKLASNAQYAITLVDEVRAELATVRAEAGERAVDLGATIAARIDNVEVVVGEVANSVEIRTGAVRDMLRDEIAAATVPLEGFGTETVTAYVESAVLDATNQVLTTMRASVEPVEGRVQAVEDALAKTTVDLAARVAGEVEQLQIATDKKVEVLSTQVAAHAEGTAASFDALLAGVEKTVVGLSAKIAGDLNGLDERITVLAGEHTALRSKVEETPAQVDTAELEVRLLNKVGDMMPEHLSKLELPAPEFELAFDGADLVVKATWGEQTVTASRKVDIGITYRGVFKDDEDYSVGNLVTHKGSMWFAKAKPTGEPGKDITGWQLAVKRGDHGRDAISTRSYEGHEPGRIYRQTDFLRVNGRLWQCCASQTTYVPEPGDITSTREWTLIGGVH